MSAQDELDFTATYKVAGHGGVAWRIDSYVSERVLVEESWDEDECSVEYAEWEEVFDTTRVKCHMVGDDSVWEHDVSDLTKLEDDEYCSCCGQIGCGWGG